MPIHWRQVAGPLITIAAAGLIPLFDRHLFRVPNPGAISFLAVAFSACLGGTASGLVSAAIFIGFAANHFSPPGQLFQLSPDNLQRMVVLIFCTPARRDLLHHQHRRGAGRPADVGARGNGEARR